VNNPNRNGDLCKRRIPGCGARVCDPQKLDFQRGVLRLTEPRSTFAEISVGVVVAFLTLTQSSSFLATLGWWRQSRRDRTTKLVQRIEIGRSHRSADFALFFPLLLFNLRRDSKWA
jgi:hypothetical protein